MVVGRQVWQIISLTLALRVLTPYHEFEAGLSYRISLKFMKKKLIQNIRQL